MNLFRRLRNLDLFVSLCALTLLLVPSTLEGLLTAVFICAALFFMCQLLPGVRAYIRRNLSRTVILITILIAACAGYLFFDMWQSSYTVQRIAQYIGLGKRVSLALFSAFGASIAAYSILAILCLLSDECLSPKKLLASTDARPYRGDLLFLLLTAFLAITICSKSSPLYPLNDWVDSNCFFTVGKSILNGKVLYRDIFEQKGPYLYFLHALAYLFSNTTFFGVYLFEIVAAFFFLYFSYQIALLYCGRSVLKWMPVLAAITYGSTAFCHGDSAEEFCLPLIAYSLMIGIQAIKEERPISLARCFRVGLSSGCILWIKYNMLGFYIGWFCVPAYLLLRHRDFKRLFKTLLLIAAGVAVASLPVLLYFASHHALSDLWEVYFYDNIFYYVLSSTNATAADKAALFVSACISSIKENVLFALLLSFSLYWFSQRSEKKTFAYVSSAFLCTVLFIFSGQNAWSYYSLILYAFSILFIIPLFHFFSLLCKPMPVCRTSRYPISVAIGFVLCLMLNNNAYLLLQPKENLPQYQFKQIIETVDNPTLLNYGFLDGGFYTVCNIMPTCKYFCSYNIQLSEIYETHSRYIENGLIDFIITRNRPLDAPMYTCVAQSEFYFEGDDWTYRLYALNSLSLASDILNTQNQDR